ncbi:MAG TPA: cbb3-type cytochrome oxidase assembly protein CcoS [Longimicrobiales bacterium]
MPVLVGRRAALATMHAIHANQRRSIVYNVNAVAGRGRMNAIFLLLPLALLLGACFAALFIWAARHGQFDDLDDPPERILHD